MPIPGTRGRGEPRGCTEPPPATAPGTREFPWAARPGFANAGQEGWGCLQPRLLTEGNFAARGKTELLKSIKKKENLEKMQQEKTGFELHLFNYSLPGLTSKSAGSQEAKPYLFHYFNTHKTANETKPKLKIKKALQLLSACVATNEHSFLKIFFLQQILKNI